MLDIKWIRNNTEEFDKLMKKRGVASNSEWILRLDEERRHTILLIQELQSGRNKTSQNFIHGKERKLSVNEIRLNDYHIEERIKTLQDGLNHNNRLQDILDSLPNLPSADVPDGDNPHMNQLIKTFGQIKQISEAKQHFEIGARLKMMNFVQTAKMSGSRFVTLKSDLAKLERALINFMIDVHTRDFGFTELSPPYLVRPAAMYNVGQLPKFSDESFETTTNYRLISTGEVPLINMVADQIIDRETLPIRYVAYSPCFRAEAGSAGRDTRGMMRMHQFAKVELVSITNQEESETEHQYLVNAAEEILRKLDLPYRIMLLCSQEMGFAAKKTFDIEVWLPGQGQYREISSCSNCGDFQARRMKTRYKKLGSNDTTFIHTLNASGLAVGRTMIAILENYQNNDGSVTIPEVLVKYMNGQTEISPP
jgi:seryl-tRNA synthetase